MIRNIIAAAIWMSLVVLSGGPAAANDDLKLGKATTETFIGRRMTVDGPKGLITLKFDKTGKVQVNAPENVRFQAFWWVSPSGYLCFVSDVWWYGGECWHLFINQKGLLSRIHPERRPDSITYPASIR